MLTLIYKITKLANTYSSYQYDENYHYCNRRKFNMYK